MEVWHALHVIPDKYSHKRVFFPTHITLNTLQKTKTIISNFLRCGKRKKMSKQTECSCHSSRKHSTYRPVGTSFCPLWNSHFESEKPQQPLDWSSVFIDAPCRQNLPSDGDALTWFLTFCNSLHCDLSPFFQLQIMSVKLFHSCKMTL